MITSTTMVVDRVTADLAAEMITIFGGDAKTQAAARASKSRNLGNAVNFCNWRQAERLITLLATEEVHGTIQ